MVNMDLKEFALSRIDSYVQKSLLRVIKDYDRVGNSIITSSTNEKIISFSCNDYFDLSHHPDVINYAIETLKKYGSGATASRLVTGSNSLYSVLEAQISQYMKYPASIVFSSGYAACMGTIPALVSKGDLIIADKCVHASMIDAAVLSGAKLMRFTHNNHDSCKRILEKHRSGYNKAIILINSVYSISGDVSDISCYKEIADRFATWLIVDDAHGIGIIDMNAVPDITIGTLSKGLASIGGFVSAQEEVIRYLSNYARSLMYSTALPPSILAAASMALRVLDTITPHPVDVANLFCKYMNIPCMKSNVLSLTFPEIHAAMEACVYLKDKGFLALPMRPPTVMKPCIRFAFCSSHKEEHIEALAKACKENINISSAFTRTIK